MEHILYEDATPEQQAAARQEVRESPHYPNYEWWDYIYEDFREVALCMGIEVDKIAFSGFWCQGDGASFTGTWGMPAKGSIMKNTRAYAGADDELIRIAHELWDAQRRNFYKLYASITRTGHTYVHSNTMILDVETSHGHTGWAGDKYDTQVTDAMRHLADWLYRRLEDEYDYLMTDDAIHEYMLANEITIDVEPEYTS